MAHRLKPTQAAFQLTNRQRAHAGLRTLKRSAVLSQSARAKARHLAKTGELEHGRWWKLIEKYARKRYGPLGENIGPIGENIAARQDTAEQVVEDWMNSPTHRQNMLAGRYSHLGIGFARRADSEYWVQHFGNR